MVELRALLECALYKAGDDGHIYRDGRRIKAKDNGHGYLTVRLSFEGATWDRYVHRLVCAAWHGAPAAGQQARHKDGTRSNNRPDNLAWATRVENEADKLVHGTRLMGDAAPWAKLTATIVTDARRRVAAGEQVATLAVEYGVTQQTMSDAVIGRRWKHLPGALRPCDARRRLTDDEVVEIRQLAGTVTQQALAERYGLARNAIYQVIARKSYRHVE